MSTLPENMIAVAISEPGAPEVLIPETRELPVPTDEQVLIKVHTAGVNRPDVAQRLGHYPPPKNASDLPGLEVSGTIVGLGKSVTRHKLGDKVMALTAGGGYAQYCVSHEGHALPIPSGLDMVEAAGVPENYFTVWSNVFDRGGLQAGENFLIHGGTSGIGTTAIQLAKAFGAIVYTTAGSDEKCDYCRKLGADLAMNYKTTDFVKDIREATDGHGIDVTLDMVGGDYVIKNWKAAAVEGRIVQIATLNGPSENVNFAMLMVKRLTHTGSTLRPRSDEFKTAIGDSLVKKVWPLLEAGTIKPIIHATFPLEDAAKAHTLMESSGHIGKIMLNVE